LPYRPLARESGQIHVCAHRGHSAGAPENTLPALLAAAERGATVCEIDVVLTRDEEIVLMHDEVLDRTTNGRGLVADYDLAALRRLDAGSWFAASFAGTPVPTLAEALVTARANDMGLLVEIKERRRADRMIERLAEVLAAARSLDEVLVISFDHPSLVHARRRIPGARTELITHARHLDPAGMATRAGAASVAIEWDMFSPEDARRLHDAGIGVRVSMPRPERMLLRQRYGLDDQAAIAEALSSGLIDALAGDDTDVVASLVRDSVST
jgi:glycerophosphoryl diester phosphodiesterase